jgi:hypothetical protein
MRRLARRRKNGYAAGVLVFARFGSNNEAFVLLGADRSYAWSDFGGRSEACDDAPVSTALRELDEETLRMVVPEDLRLDQDPIISKTLCGHQYFMHVAMYRGDESAARAIVSDYAKTHETCRYAEKTQLRWFRWSTIRDLSCRAPIAEVSLRDVFRRTIVMRLDAVEASLVRLCDPPEYGPPDTPASPVQTESDALS